MHHLCIDRLAILHARAFTCLLTKALFNLLLSIVCNIPFTGAYSTLSPINVKTSRTWTWSHLNDYKVCAKYEGEVKKAGSITVNCKVPVVRFVFIQRKAGSPTYWTMQICEAVIIGHRVACKYCGEFCYIPTGQQWVKTVYTVLHQILKGCQ